ncbi:LacI family DNA-binding transcriptional regulator [Evansella tamaricis]|uniref:LacI family transcriptional regulator n=1 Tax=Evansella tamaricis TaxID=2069301 RepID=A0ABS6JEP1_9BACI|nr:LacI family DNA-binding transcriptional regulator [Evansella tamaricis]MBU9711669.1 LacI family transcriptional regulator [Evansella tamaricis]
MQIKSSIKDIAKRANVSVSTVSRVLNNSKYVSEDLKRRVLSVVEETGFKPNMVARGLVNKKTSLIGVLIPRISNNFFSKLIEGIEEVLQTYGYNILLSTSYNEIEKELEYLNIFEDRQLDGIIFSVTEFTDQHKNFFGETVVPTVFLGQKVETLKKYPYVTIDNIKAAYEATRYLIKQKHKRIAIMAGPEKDCATGDNRLQGYLEALKEAGLPLYTSWQTRRYHTIDDGYYAASQIMSQSEKPTAIFACSDQQALGAINYLREHGYRVPEDISVMGFDDVDLATVFRPKLTTVKQNPVDMGATAARLLIDQIHGNSLTALENLVPYRLVVRESTKSL